MLLRHPINLFCMRSCCVKEKDIPFIQLDGDQPVYTSIVQLRNENRVPFEKFFLFLVHSTQSACLLLQSANGFRDLACCREIARHGFERQTPPEGYEGFTANLRSFAAKNN